MAEHDTDDPALPLDYQSGRDQKNLFAERLKHALSLIVGFIIAAVATLVVGAFSSSLAVQGPEFSFHSVPLAVIYFTAAGLALVGCLFKLLRPPRKWFLAGLLLGTGLTCLLEGGCFTGA